MGQARKRGTREERVAAAADRRLAAYRLDCERRKQAQAARAAALKAKLDAMSTTEREAFLGRPRVSPVALMGIAAALAGGHG